MGFELNRLIERIEIGPYSLGVLYRTYSNVFQLKRRNDHQGSASQDHVRRAKDSHFSANTLSSSTSGYGSPKKQGRKGLGHFFSCSVCIPSLIVSPLSSSLDDIHISVEAEKRVRACKQYMYEHYLGWFQYIGQRKKRYVSSCSPCVSIYPP